MNWTGIGLGDYARQGAPLAIAFVVLGGTVGVVDLSVNIMD